MGKAERTCNAIKEDNNTLEYETDTLDTSENSYDNRC